MIVSNFSVSGDPFNGVWSYDDYRLQITNLDDQPITYLVEAHISADAYETEQYGRVPQAVPNVSWIEAGPLMSPMAAPAGRHGDTVGWFIRVAAGGSEMFNIGERRDDSGHPNPWLLGFVTLRVPVGRIYTEDRRYAFGAQSRHPVPTLLSTSSQHYRPKKRVEAYANSYKNYHEMTDIPFFFFLGDDTTIVDIPLATPGAQVDIGAESLLVSQFGKQLGRLQDDTEPLRAGAGAEGLPEDDRLLALVDLVVAFGSLERDELAALNKEMERRGATLKLTR